MQKSEYRRFGKWYMCPICGKKARGVKGLKVHYFKKHNRDYCPICKKRFKRLALHFAEMKDKEHQALYYLLVERRSRNSIKYNEVKRIIDELFKVELKKIAEVFEGDENGFITMFGMRKAKDFREEKGWNEKGIVFVDSRLKKEEKVSYLIHEFVEMILQKYLKYDRDKAHKIAEEIEEKLEVLI